MLNLNLSKSNNFFFQFERVYSNNNRVYLTNLKLQRLADTIFQKLDQKMIPNPNPIQSSQANRADVLNELESHKNELEGLRQVLMEFERNNGWRCQVCVDNPVFHVFF